jgi:hypothetical protein
MAGSEYYDDYAERTSPSVSKPNERLIRLSERNTKMNDMGLDPYDTADVELFLQMEARIAENKQRSLDPNVKSVMNKYESRARVGFEKYKTDTTRSDLSLQDWLTHLQEELMDATIYVERLKQDLKDV